MIMMAYSMKIRNLVSNIIRLFSMINQKRIYNTHMSNSEKYFNLVYTALTQITALLLVACRQPVCGPAEVSLKVL